MMSYAGIELPTVPPKLAAWVETNIPPREVYEFSPHYDTNSMAGIPAPPPFVPPPVRPGILYWPTGASRWAIYHTVLTGEQMAEMRTVLAEGQGNGGYKKADLVLDDGKTTLTTQMTMVPPRPLSGWFPESTDGKLPTIDLDYREMNDLWLVTLVDTRFFWWFRQGTPTTSTFKTMVEGMITALGETATVPSTFGENYPTPKTRWSQAARPVPVLLDAACSAVGRKLVRKLDGTLEFQTWEEARDAAKNFLVRQYELSAPSTPLAPPALSEADFARIAGGVLDYEDLRRHVPATVQVYYSTTAKQDKTLASLAIPDYLSYTGRVNEAAVVRIDDLSGGETSSLSTFVTEAAGDWYGWQLANVNLVLGGLAGWDGCGWQEAVRWDANGPPTTRVVRPPFGLGAALGVAVVSSGTPPTPSTSDWKLGLITAVDSNPTNPTYTVCRAQIDNTGGIACDQTGVPENPNTGKRARTSGNLITTGPLRVGDPVLFRLNPQDATRLDITPWQLSARGVDFEYVETQAFDTSTCQMVTSRRHLKIVAPGADIQVKSVTGGSISIYENQ